MRQKYGPIERGQETIQEKDMSHRTKHETCDTVMSRSKETATKHELLYNRLRGSWTAGAKHCL